MNILVYGAGVLGSLYAARLQEAGQHVSLLARGQRLQDIREHGILLEDVLTGQTTTTHVKMVEQLGPEDQYDLAVVTTGHVDDFPLAHPVKKDSSSEGFCRKSSID